MKKLEERLRIIIREYKHFNKILLKENIELKEQNATLTDRIAELTDRLTEAIEQMNIIQGNK